MVKNLIFLLLVMQVGLAEIHQPIPIENQLRNSTGVIYAVYKGSSFKKMPKGEVISEYSFKILDSLGIGVTEIINRNHFLVVATGGVWQGLVYNSASLPTFFPGEDVVLFLKKGNYGFELTGNKMGKYNIIVVNGERFISSSIFKNHPKLGKIKISEFNQLLRNKFGKELSLDINNINKNKAHQEITLKTKNDPGRTIASGMEREPASVPDDSMWIVIVTLGILGAIGIKLGRD